MTLRLWHGGAPWDGPLALRPGVAGSRESGPGFYLTTSYATAARYGRGGNGILQVELKDDIRWLHDARMPLDALVAEVRTIPRLRARQRIIDDLRRSAARISPADVPLNFLVNLATSNGASHGVSGLNLAAWLVDAGVDARLEPQSPPEEWVVLVNPAKAIAAYPVRAHDVLAADYELPSVSQQIASPCLPDRAGRARPSP